jgi:ATP-dependent Clp protease, protease subunit
MNNEEKDIRKFCLDKGISGVYYDDYVKNAYINPMVLEERQMNVTSLDVYSRLLMDRIIFVNGEIESNMANILTAQLLWLDQQSDKPINIYLNTNGGSVIDGLQIIDTTKFITAPISTTCLGMAASMGAVILSCGENGKRFALPHSRVMIHQASGGYHGKAEDVKTSYEQLLRCQQDVYEILAENMNMTYEEVEKLCSNTDKWFIGEEAVKLGIVDEIVKRK